MTKLQYKTEKQKKKKTHLKVLHTVKSRQLRGTEATATATTTTITTHL